MEPVSTIVTWSKQAWNVALLVSSFLTTVTTAPSRPGEKLNHLRGMDRDAITAEGRLHEVSYARESLVASFIFSDQKPTLQDVEQAKASEGVATQAVENWIAQEDSYIASVISSTSPQNPASITEAALTSFVFETRRALGPWKPTRSFDETCPDTVKDQLLFDLAKAVLGDDEALYAATLGQVAKAVSCSSLQRAVHLNSALATGYDRAISRFPAALRPAVRQALLSSLLNTFLIVHDETKFLGISPIHAWLRVNRAELGQLLAQPWSVVRQAGLWLKDLSSGRLVQVGELCEEGLRGQDCVSGTHLLDAMTDPRRLGTGTCSALEMISKKFDSVRGYSCEKGLCSGEEGAVIRGLRANENRPVPFFGNAVPTGFRELNPAKVKGSCRAGCVPLPGRTRFGADVAELQATRCTGRGNGGDDGSIGVPSNRMRCVTESIYASSPRAKQLAMLECAHEVTSPLARMTQTTTGWPSDACRYASASTDGGQPDETGNRPPKSEPDKDKERKEKEDKAKEFAKKQVEEKREQIKKDSAKAGYPVTARTSTSTTLRRPSTTPRPFPRRSSRRSVGKLQEVLHTTPAPIRRLARST
ncbi:MAG: hypothetical protein HY698_20665 [Deltaproteobacteria bacterium]|nr:hypothetical protein [Deltaproteobacteria bacterium]